MRCIRAVKALRLVGTLAKCSVVALYTDGRSRHALRSTRRRRDCACRQITGGEVAAYLDRRSAPRRPRARPEPTQSGPVGASSPKIPSVRRTDLEAAGIAIPRAVTPTPCGSLGDKISARRRSRRAGRRPGHSLERSRGRRRRSRRGDLSPPRLGFPLVIKASRRGAAVAASAIVDVARRSGRKPSPSAVLRARQSRPSATAASSSRRRSPSGRHIEVQIAADQHGNVHSLGCRDCSVQRRHQKVLEEAPPPGLSPEFLADLETAAIRVAAAVNYCGVGTVEFLVAAPEFHFLEMNPRLQVEHGITEAVHRRRPGRAADSDRARRIAGRPEFQRAGHRDRSSRLRRGSRRWLPARPRPNRTIRPGARTARAHRYRRCCRQQRAGRLRLADREGHRDRTRPRRGARPPRLRTSRLRPRDRGRRNQQGLPARHPRRCRLPRRRCRHGVARSFLREPRPRARLRCRGADRSRHPLPTRAHAMRRGSTSTPMRAAWGRRASRRRADSRSISAPARKATGSKYSPSARGATACTATAESSRPRCAKRMLILRASPSAAAPFASSTTAPTQACASKSKGEHTPSATRPPARCVLARRRWWSPWTWRSAIPCGPASASACWKR